MFICNLFVTDSLAADQTNVSCLCDLKFLFSAKRLLVVRQEGRVACKNPTPSVAVDFQKVTSRSLCLPCCKLGRLNG